MDNTRNPEGDGPPNPRPLHVQQPPTPTQSGVFNVPSRKIIVVTDPQSEDTNAGLKQNTPGPDICYVLSDEEKHFDPSMQHIMLLTKQITEKLIPVKRKSTCSIKGKSKQQKSVPVLVQEDEVEKIPEIYARFHSRVRPADTDCNDLVIEKEIEYKLAHQKHNQPILPHDQIPALDKISSGEFKIPGELTDEKVDGKEVPVEIIYKKNIKTLDRYWYTILVKRRKQVVLEKETIEDAADVVFPVEQEASGSIQSEKLEETPRLGQSSPATSIKSEQLTQRTSTIVLPDVPPPPEEKPPQSPATSIDSPRKSVESPASIDIPGEQRASTESARKSSESPTSAATLSEQRASIESARKTAESPGSETNPGEQRASMDSPRRSVESPASIDIPGEQRASLKSPRTSLESRASMDIPGTQRASIESSRPSVESRASGDIPGAQRASIESSRPCVESGASMDIPGTQRASIESSRPSVESCASGDIPGAQRASIESPRTSVESRAEADVPDERRASMGPPRRSVESPASIDIPGERGAPVEAPGGAEGAAEQEERASIIVLAEEPKGVRKSVDESVESTSEPEEVPVGTPEQIPKVLTPTPVKTCGNPLCKANQEQVKKMERIQLPAISTPSITCGPGCQTVSAGNVVSASGKLLYDGPMSSEASVKPHSIDTEYGEYDGVTGFSDGSDSLEQNEDTHSKEREEDNAFTTEHLNRDEQPPSASEQLVKKPQRAASFDAQKDQPTRKVSKMRAASCGKVCERPLCPFLNVERTEVKSQQPVAEVEQTVEEKKSRSISTQIPHEWRSKTLETQTSGLELPKEDGKRSKQSVASSSRNRVGTPVVSKTQQIATTVDIPKRTPSSVGSRDSRNKPEEEKRGSNASDDSSNLTFDEILASLGSDEQSALSKATLTTSRDQDSASAERIFKEMSEVISLTQTKDDSQQAVTRQSMIDELNKREAETPVEKTPPHEPQVAFGDEESQRTYTTNLSLSTQIPPDWISKSSGTQACIKKSKSRRTSCPVIQNEEPVAPTTVEEKKRPVVNHSVQVLTLVDVATHETQTPASRDKSEEQEVGAGKANNGYQVYVCCQERQSVKKPPVQSKTATKDMNTSTKDHRHRCIHGKAQTVESHPPTIRCVSDSVQANLTPPGRSLDIQTSFTSYSSEDEDDEEAPRGVVKTTLPAIIEVKPKNATKLPVRPPKTANEPPKPKHEAKPKDGLKQIFGKQFLNLSEDNDLSFASCSSDASMSTSRDFLMDFTNSATSSMIAESIDLIKSNREERSKPRQAYQLTPRPSREFKQKPPEKVMLSTEAQCQLQSQGPKTEGATLTSHTLIANYIVSGGGAGRFLARPEEAACGKIVEEGRREDVKCEKREKVVQKREELGPKRAVLIPRVRLRSPPRDPRKGEGEDASKRIAGADLGPFESTMVPNKKINVNRKRLIVRDNQAMSRARNRLQYYRKSVLEAQKTKDPEKTQQNIPIILCTSSIVNASTNTPLYQHINLRQTEFSNICCTNCQSGAFCTCKPAVI